MLKPNHIVAARGLLRWSQGDLAKECGISDRTIGLIENEKQNASQETLVAIQMAFDRAGVAFKDNGVFLEDRRMTILEGANRLMRLLDDVPFVLQGSGELLIDGADERQTPQSLISKVSELRAKGLKMRHLIKEGDRYLRGNVTEYRWLPEESFVNQVIFIYGDTVAIDKQDTQSLFMHRDAHLAEFLRKRFNLLWGILKQPDTSEAQDAYEV